VARRSEELVAEIRERRQRLGEAAETLFSLDQVRQHVRNEPTAWLLGGALTGAIASRFLMPMAVNMAGGWLKGKVKDTALGLLVTAIRGRRTPEDGGDETESAAELAAQFVPD
jgi:hypothetical protein